MQRNSQEKINEIPIQRHNIIYETLIKDILNFVHRYFYCIHSFQYFDVILRVDVLYAEIWLCPHPVILTVEQKIDTELLFKPVNFWLMLLTSQLFCGTPPHRLTVVTVVHSRTLYIVMPVNRIVNNKNVYLFMPH